MAKKHSVTTVARWLAEELPRGIKCYIEYRNVMLELLGVIGNNGTLKPMLRPVRTFRTVGRFTPTTYTISLNTQVVLSLDEELSGKPWDRVSQQLRPVAPDCWTLGKYLTHSTDDELNVTLDSISSANSSVFCD